MERLTGTGGHDPQRRNGPRSFRFSRLSVLLLIPVLLGAARPDNGTELDPARTYRPPVDAPVIDPFRLPENPWEPGNRGLEYATPAGTPVRAAGPGIVTFAGPVAGSLHVTIQHPDGLRSSYSFLAAVRTSVGRTVAGGEVIAVSAESLHVGFRRGDRYLDPALLWGTPVSGGHVRLVPIGGDGDAGPIATTGPDRGASRSSLPPDATGDRPGPQTGPNRATKALVDSIRSVFFG